MTMELELLPSMPTLRVRHCPLGVKERHARLARSSGNPQRCPYLALRNRRRCFFLGSDWFVQGNVAEMHVLSEMTDNGQDMVMFCTSSPREDAWVPGSVGFQNGSGLEVENNQSGTPSVLATASLNPMLPAVIGFQGNTVFANYEPVITTAGPICGGGYLGAWANTGFNASFSFDWIRMRPAEPGRAMPKAVAPCKIRSVRRTEFARSSHVGGRAERVAR